MVEDAGRRAPIDAELPAMGAKATGSRNARKGCGKAVIGEKGRDDEDRSPLAVGQQSRLGRLGPIGGEFPELARERSPGSAGSTPARNCQMRFSALRNSFDSRL